MDDDIERVNFPSALVCMKGVCTQTRH
jgi:hypothetical protein